MNNTSNWTHHCDSTGMFVTLPVAEECSKCKINSSVASVRNAGYLATPFNKPGIIQPGKRHVAALFLPKVTQFKKENAEYENQIYDRNG